VRCGMGPQRMTRTDIVANTSAEIDLSHFASRGGAQYVYNSVF